MAGSGEPTASMWDHSPWGLDFPRAKLQTEKFALPEANLHATNVTVLAQVEFKIAGTYFIEVLVDDVMKLRYPVPIILAPPQQPGGQAKAPQPPAGEPAA